MKQSERVYYADQPAGLALGASVARLSFGVVDVDKEEVETVVTIVIPVESLVLLVNDLTSTLNDPRFKDTTINGLKRAIRVIEKGVDGEPSATLRKSSTDKNDKAKKRQRRAEEH